MTFTELLRLDKQLRASQPGLPKAKPKVPQPIPGANHAATTDTTTSGHHDTTMLPHQQLVGSSNHDAVAPSTHHAKAAANHDAVMPGMAHQIRQAVHRIGKEAATYRFTREEKVGLMEVVYQQGKVGIRTSENEIVRIGVNWLLQNHRTQEQESVLSLVLEALRA